MAKQTGAKKPPEPQPAKIIRVKIRDKRVKPHK